MTRTALLAALGLAGCSSQPSPTPAPELPAVVVADEPAPAPAPPADPVTQPVAAQPPAPPPTFPFPPDLAGQALPKVLAPSVPLKLPGEAGGGPKARPVPVRVLNPETLAPGNYALAPLVPPAVSPSRPGAPAEKVPFDLGVGAELGVKPVLPVVAIDTPRAKDVGVVPPAPMLGRQAADRVPFDDPTADVGNAVIAGGSVPVPLAVSPFLRAFLPDPFELAEQVKPAVPPAVEPKVVPVEVNPQRAK